MKKKAKKPKFDLYWEDPNCTFESEFQILVPTEKEARVVDAKINKALENCVKALRRIGKKHPKAGIGDTATDECIANAFYDILH